MAGSNFLEEATMPATAVELMDSRTTVTGEQGSHEKRFTVTGSASEEDAIAAIDALIESTYESTSVGILVLKSIEVRPVAIDEDNDAACRWEGVATYGPPSTGGTPQQPADSTFSFETGGATRHMTQSLETVSAMAAAVGSGEEAEAPDFKRAIGVERDESGNTTIAGVDVVSPQFQFRETHYFTDSEVSSAFKVALADLTGRVNDAAFKGFAAGEVLFLGASGQRSGDDANDLWQITFSFAVQRNRTDVSVSEDIVLADVGGWDYVWVLYGSAEDAAAKTTVRKPTASYVERVYESGDFGTLQIGTGS
jgi:hypothetical protein